MIHISSNHISLINSEACHKQYFRPNTPHVILSLNGDISRSNLPERAVTNTRYSTIRRVTFITASHQLPARHINSLLTSWRWAQDSDLCGCKAAYPVLLTALDLNERLRELSFSQIACYCLPLAFFYSERTEFRVGVPTASQFHGRPEVNDKARS